MTTTTTLYYIELV